MAVRLFVGNMPYGATEADLRAHFSAVGEPSQVVIPVDRETGRPRGFAFVEFLDRAIAEQAIERFNQQPFMGREPVGQRSAAARGASGRRRVPSERPPGRGRRVRRSAPAHAVAAVVGLADPGRRAPGGFRSGPRSGRRARHGQRNFGPPKKKSASSEKRWEAKERGPKGPIKERYTGRLGGLYDDPNDEPVTPAGGLRRRRVESVRGGDD